MKGQMSNEPDKHLDERLDKVLRRLPDRPVSSNFTARVMQQIEREDPAPALSPALRWNLWLHKFLPRTALAAVLLTAGLFSVHTWKDHRRADIVTGIKVVSNVGPLTDPDVLDNVDAIRRMSQSSPADDELLALMQ